MARMASMGGLLERIESGATARGTFKHSLATSKSVQKLVKSSSKSTPSLLARV